MFRGWFVGDFEPTSFRTKDFEVGTTLHPKGSAWDVHYHKLGTEVNWIIEGKMKMHDKILSTGDIFVLSPYEIANPVFLEDTRVLVIKTPSVPGDKYVIEEAKKKSDESI